MSERWPSVKEIVKEALSRPDVERSGFLDDACGSDAELRKEVDSLLAMESDSFARPMLDRSSPLNTGTRLGNYEIAEPIGAGGRVRSTWHAT